MIISESFMGRRSFLKAPETERVSNIETLFVWQSFFSSRNDTRKCFFIVLIALLNKHCFPRDMNQRITCFVCLPIYYLNNFRNIIGCSTNLTVDIKFAFCTVVFHPVIPHVLFRKLYIAKSLRLFATPGRIYCYFGVVFETLGSPELRSVIKIESN